METKKISIGIGIIIFLVTLYAVYAFFFKNKQSTAQPIGVLQNMPFGTSTPIQEITQATSTNSATTSVSDVRKKIPEQAVENIEKAWSAVDLQGKVFATTTDTYLISYFKDFDRIQIHVFEDPSEKNRKIAEEELVRILGIPQKDICWFNYSVTRKTWESQNKTQEIGLSFCPGSVDLSKESNSTP